MQDLTDRHPAVQDVARFFSYDHLKGDLQEISKEFHDLAERMIQRLPDNPMLTRGLSKLLDAKDAMVRSALPAQEPVGPGQIANAPSGVEATPAQDK